VPCTHFDPQSESLSGKLITLYSQKTYLSNRRSLAGLALRQCIELGYHRSANKFSLSCDPLRLEMRKRVFWCSYGIDRAASMTLGRPFAIPDQEIDIEVGMLTRVRPSRPIFLNYLIVSFGY
jgi:hypothetical protein